MPLTRVSRAAALRAAGVVLITALVSIAAACSSEDTVDTIPPPWPNATTTSTAHGPQTPTPEQTSTSTTRHRTSPTGTHTSTSRR